MNTHLRLVEPSNVNRSVPVRPANAELRSREYLTEAEVEKLIKAARDGRYGHRDATLILIAFRHGLRATEICDLEWSQVEFGRSASLHVRRAKNGKPSVHPLRGDEIRALRELRRQFPDSPMSSRQSATARSPPTPSIGLSSASASAPSCRSRFTPTCCGTAAVMLWPMQGMIRGPSKTGSVIGQFSIRSGTPSWRRRGSRISGDSRYRFSLTPQKHAPGLTTQASVEWPIRLRHTRPRNSLLMADRPRAVPLTPSIFRLRVQNKLRIFCSLSFVGLCLTNADVVRRPRTIKVALPCPKNL